MLPSQLLMQANAVGFEISHRLQRGIEIAIDLLAERRRLLDRGVLGEYQHLGTRRGAVGDPTGDLVLPRLSVAGLSIGYCAEATLRVWRWLMGAYVVTARGFIQNCMA